MAKSKFQGGEFSFGSPDDENARPMPKEEPFRILLMGDFRGGSASPQPLKERQIVEIDRDNFGELMSKWQPRVQVPIGGSESVTIRAQDLEDFEPDRLFRKLPAFASLLDLRKRLQDRATFNDAVAEIKGWGRAAEVASPPPPTGPVAVPDNLLDQILGQSEKKEAAFSIIPGQSEWDRFIREIVSPHVIAAPDPRLGDYEKVVDEAVGVRMRTILHDPGFQALEAIWRGLFLLVKNLETDGQLKLFILDASRDVLARDLNDADDLSESGLYQHLVVRAKDKPWALVAGHYTFGPEQRDLELLGNLAQIVAKVGISFLGGAHPSVLGCKSLVETPDPDDWQPNPLWQQLRQFPPARHLGLALPRYLLRLPYGKETTTLETFAFEELPEGSGHESYLWGNPAFFCALLVGQSFSQETWDMRPGDVSEVTDLPVHIHEEDGERVAKPCAEVALRDDALDVMIENGLIPLLCARAAQDSARVARFQSLVGEALAGRWSG